MSQSGDSTRNDRIDDGIGTYDVVILAEHEVTAVDARQIHSLHDSIADQVVYHLLIPVEDAAGRIEAAMGTLGTGELLSAPVVLSEVDLEAIREESQEEADHELHGSLAALAVTGAQAVGQLISDAPVDALEAKVKQVDCREVIILTRPHVVAEFFHVDWSSRARRKLGVPVLHLLEQENFDEQAGGGEGVTGL
ncbi:hypothetical protein [Nocardioides campestrisoli]|uniref:hypothetical protein n=1 Tax=Nocardioides campestrisoli TaxID=2736757 RepID=UPI0015E6D0FF|nr:hypothetical protein [Nocardioides campestrisoli]